MARHHKRCVNCGAHFVASRKDAEVCSKRCHNQIRRKSHNGGNSMKRIRARSIFAHLKICVQNQSQGDWEPFAEPLEADDSMPGTAERMREYRKRLELGRELWHQDDRNSYGELD
jgi:hypothetical protein